MSGSESRTYARLMDKMVDRGYKVQLSGSLTGEGRQRLGARGGERIELLEDQSINVKFAPDAGPYVAPPKMTAPITLHHIHIYAPEGSVAEAKAWYVKVFGMVPGKRYKTEGAPYEASDLPGVNMNFAPAHGPVLPTKGRALDHIGFEVKNLEAFCREARGERHQARPGLQGAADRDCQCVCHRSLGHAHRADGGAEQALTLDPRAAA